MSEDRKPLMLGDYKFDYDPCPRCGSPFRIISMDKKLRKQIASCSHCGKIYDPDTGGA